MKHKNFLIIGAFFATVVVCFQLHTQAAPKKASPSPDAGNSADADASPATAATASGKMRATPFKGMIAAVDDKAKTFTIASKENSRVLKITEEAKSAWTDGLIGFVTFVSFCDSAVLSTLLRFRRFNRDA